MEQVEKHQEASIHTDGNVQPAVRFDWVLHRKMLF